MSEYVICVFVYLLGMTACIQAENTPVKMTRFSETEYHFINGTVQSIEETRSASDCATQCQIKLKDDCRSFGFKESAINKCLVSSEYVFRQTAGMTFSSVDLQNYALYSITTCHGLDKFNPHSRTCVGLYQSAGLHYGECKTHCEGGGKYLLTLEKIEDGRWLLEQMNSDPAWNRPVYIGGYRTSGNWEWNGRITGAVDILTNLWNHYDQDHGNPCLVLWGAAGLGDEPCHSNNINYHFCESDVID